MTAFIILPLLCCSAIQVMSVEFLYNGHEMDHGRIQFWRTMQGPFIKNCFWKNCPNEMKDIVALEKEIDDYLNKADSSLQQEKESQAEDTRKFCKMYQDFLLKIRSTLECVRQMVEERRTACKAREQVIQDLQLLVSKCAKVRVEMQEKLAACQATISKNMKGENNTSESVNENSMELINGDIIANDNPEIKSEQSDKSHQNHQSPSEMQESPLSHQPHHLQISEPKLNEHMESAGDSASYSTT